jgi:hypothetical protein
MEKSTKYYMWPREALLKIGAVVCGDDWSDTCADDYQNENRKKAMRTFRDMIQSGEVSVVKHGLHGSTTLLKKWEAAGEFIEIGHNGLMLVGRPDSVTTCNIDRKEVDTYLNRHFLPKAKSSNSARVRVRNEMIEKLNAGLPLPKREDLEERADFEQWAKKERPGLTKAGCRWARREAYKETGKKPPKGGRPKEEKKSNRAH